MASFDLCHPDLVRTNQTVMQYLIDAASDFGGIVSVNKALDLFDKQKDAFVVVSIGQDIVGSIYLTFTQQETGRVMTSVLLGGIRFSEWAKELSKFYYKLAKDMACDEFMLMGRRGFKKYFPELDEIATVFRVKLTT